MKSTAHIQGHPIHPMLIPYPFALLSAALAFDVAAKMSRRASWARTAGHLISAGLGSGLVAAVPGIVDYYGSVPPRTAARRTATRHAVCNVSALACFALAGSRRKSDGRMPGAALALAALGTGLLSVGGWLGGDLVYHQHVAMVDEPSSERLPQVQGP